ncbi:MAG: hypothetical protein JSV76_01960 [Candidatus Bathyarchaeota archaeon]|nr:MAG: hypothetical protein JSV76_01960 [Candidatus Bathyarchaeota archaeon]
MGERYNPDGYEKDKDMIEKIFFSFPEYLIYETRLGGWFAFQLQRILSWMNKVSIEKIPSTRDSIYRRMIESLTDMISVILSWINYFAEKGKRE